MEKGPKFGHFINRLLCRKDGPTTKETPTSSFNGLTLNSEYLREVLLRSQYQSHLRTALQGFGEIDGSVVIDDIGNLLQAMIAFPKFDQFINFPLSQVKGDLQTALLTNPEARGATAKWLSGVHEDLIGRHSLLEKETQKWEEDLEKIDFEFRGLTTEADRQVKASANAIRLLSGKG